MLLHIQEQMNKKTSGTWQNSLVLMVFIVQFPLLFWHYDTWWGTIKNLAARINMDVLIY